MVRYAVLLALLATTAQSSPLQDIFERNYATSQLPEALCKKVNVVVKVLKSYKATPFCSSYLGIPAVTSTSTMQALLQINTRAKLMRP